MDDQFPPKDENSAKADFVVPESGPGEEAANFSAKAQRDKFLGGSSETPKQPEIEPSNPTEASKGFINKWAERIRNNKFKVLTHTVGAGLLASAVVDVGHGNYGAAVTKGTMGAFSIAFDYARQGGWK